MIFSACSLPLVETEVQGATIAIACISNNCYPESSGKVPLKHYKRSL
jgi:hypothetical protein